MLSYDKKEILNNIATFVNLGEMLRSELKTGAIDNYITQSCEANHWFTQKSVRQSIYAISETMLGKERLTQWLSAYSAPQMRVRDVGVVMAGNIPLVGLFDMLCVLICGHRCRVKLSSKDRVLMEHVIALLREINPKFSISQLNESIDIDAVIATGADDAVRYFNSLYSSLPLLTRGHRTSVAVISASQTGSELEGLREDCFQYFGLGCRNVSHLFVPSDYDIGAIVRSFSAEKITHPSFRNEYRQNKALLTMQGVDFVDGGYFTLRKDDALGCTNKLSDITFTRYENVQQVENWVQSNDTKIQCIVSTNIEHPRSVGFGKSQRPELWDYADGRDVIKFLLSLESV